LLVETKVFAKIHVFFLWTIAIKETIDRYGSLSLSKIFLLLLKIFWGMRIMCLPLWMW